MNDMDVHITLLLTVFSGIFAAWGLRNLFHIIFELLQCNLRMYPSRDQPRDIKFWKHSHFSLTKRLAYHPTKNSRLKSWGITSHLT